MKSNNKKVAIIGVSLRLPGSNNLDELYQHLLNKDCHISEVPDERWKNIASNKKPAAAWGAFVDNVDGFDAEFFNVSPREAQTMDPQQRFILELSHQAIEDAAYAPKDLENSKTGVFMGVCHWDYAELYEQTGLNIDAYLPTGLAYSIIANRVSHYFDLKGPSVTNDSACSSALVAILQAVQAIRLGECSQALAGGINLLLSPNHFNAFSKNGMLSKTGESKAFDKSANGYVRGEGGAVILLKSLDDAIKDKDPIHAIINGGSTNHGGKTNSLTVTNPKAQAELIQDVYSSNGFVSESIGYIEAHGTGTPLGDPIEVLGLKMAFAALRKETGEPLKKQSCALGSIKTNMGHLEGAAGMAGLLKILVSLKNKTLLPNANFEEENPLLKLENSPFYVVKQAKKWPQLLNLPLRAGVSAFGFGGTNAHIALEELVPKFDNKYQQEHAYIVPISARNKKQLVKYAQSLMTFIALHKEQIELSSLAYTLQIARDHMQHRASFIVNSLDELQQGLFQLIKHKSLKENVCYEATTLLDNDNLNLDNDQINELIKSQKGKEIAQAWTNNVHLDWKQLYSLSNIPNRIHLPSYIFAQDKHWFPKSSTQISQNNYPIIQHSKHSYSVALASNHYLLKEHIIAGQAILPGVVVLEFIRKIASEFVLNDPDTAVKISDVIWLRPVTTRHSVLTFHVEILELANKTTFKVTSEDASKQKVFTLCQGAIRRISHQQELIKTSPNQGVGVATDGIYRRLQNAGIVHGASFKVMEKVVLSDDIATASIRLNQYSKNDIIQWQNHPIIIDAAIQAVVALLPESTNPGIPFSVENIEFIKPLSEQANVIIRQLDKTSKQGNISRYDLDIFNAKDDLSIKIRGLATKTLTDVKPFIDQTHATLMVAIPIWELKQAVKVETSNNKIILWGLTDRYKYLPNLENTQEHNCVLEPLILPSKITDSLALEQVLLLLVNKFKNLTRSSQKTQILLAMPSYISEWLSPALSGLFKTINLESSLISARIVSIENYNKSDVVDELLSEEISFSNENAEVKYDKTNQRLVKLFKGVNESLLADIKRKGVYWITGGLGALGQIFARHLIKSGVDHVYLSSRSPISESENKLSALSDLKQHISYLGVDVTDKEAVALAVKKIHQEQGQLTGLIHAAGIIKDGLLINKADQDIADVLAPKVQGVINLDNATKDIRLDSFVVFSSIASLYGNLGQADYSAANGFLDGFMQWRTTAVKQGLRYGRSSTINWPLFANGGMKVEDNVLKSMKQRMGVIPLTNKQAFLAYNYVTSQNINQLAVAYGEQQAISDFFLNKKVHKKPETQKKQQVEKSNIAQVSKDIVDIKLALNDLIIKLFAEVLVMDEQKVRTDVPFDTYGFDSIIAVELIERLEKNFGELPKTLFFEHINLDSIVMWLIDERSDEVTQLFSSGQTESLKESPENSENSKTVNSEHISEKNIKVESNDDNHDIAVIGIGGSYPGAKDLDAFWENIKSGKHAFEPIPKERWKHQDIYHHERDILGKSTIQTGSFLDDIDKFDPRYFNISQVDAELMSPEVRLMLQVAVETFEDAGYSKEYMQQKMDADVAVLVGTMSNHYNLYGFQNMLTRGSQASGSYTGTLPNMISYYYGFTGPSVFVDTMCSAAATCIDMAVRMLRTGQTKMVLAGGINLLLHPNNMVSSSQEHFTTKTAEIIRSYGVGADGTILGEGAGTVLLKPLKDAQRDGDNIQAVIRGTALSNAGERNGFTVPNPNMQAKAIRQALDDANISARTISYLEGHGSGTSLGDPIEIRALNKTFLEDTEDQKFCAIGSVKSNIAHLLAAAGIVGFTKVLLQMRHKQLVPSLHSEKINPAINFENSPFVVQQELSQWQRPIVNIDGVQQQFPRRAGITSIGAGGMNSHIILEEYITPQIETSLAVNTSHLMVFSAMHLTALKRLLSKHKKWLAKHIDISFDRLAYTLQVGRTALNCRLAFSANSTSDLINKIDEFLNQKNDINFYYIENVLEAQTAKDKSIINQYLMQGNLDEIAKAWVAGAKPDWDLLWQKTPLRISMPSYSFDKVHCWYEVFDDAPNILNPEAFRRKLHPFISKNTSDLNGLSFKTEIKLSDLLDYQFKYNNKAQIIPFVVIDIALALSNLVGKDQKEGQQLSLSELNLSPCKLHEVEHIEYTVNIVSNSNSNKTPLSFVLEIQASSYKNGKQYHWFDVKSSLNMSIDDTYQLRPLSNITKHFDQNAINDIWEQGALSYTPYHNIIDNYVIDDNGQGEIYFSPAQSHQNTHHNNCTLSAELLMLIQQIGQLLGHHFNFVNWNQFNLVNLSEFSNKTNRTIECTKIRFDIKDRNQERFNIDLYLLDAKNTILASYQNIEFGELTTVSNPSQIISLDKSSDNTNSLEKELIQYLRQEMSSIVKFPEEDIHLKTGFYMLGFDSISLTTLTDKINGDYGTKLTPALFYEVENLEQLTNYILALGVISVKKHIENSQVKSAIISLNSSGSNKAIKAINKSSKKSSEIVAKSNKFAIIGMDGKFPGANNCEELWALLNSEEDALSDFPLERYSPDFQTKIAEQDFCKRGGFCQDVSGFDPHFFNISPSEAKLMDPQHRLFLQVAWNALEMSGWKTADLEKNTGVFVGVSANDYLGLLKDHGTEVDAYTATGNSHAMLANRLSYFLDIHGPSEAIDTACSSSLVAINRAIESIQNGVCNMAIAGGVNLNLSLDSFVGPYKAGMLSPEGKCKTFSSDADGYVRGEGACAIIIKPLAQAEADGDDILAVIVGSAINHGGRANSLTAPNIKAQSDLIVTAMGEIDPRTISYIETHGTGTHLGDPVEINALKKAYQRLAIKHGITNFESNTCGLGSVKTNIGHLESAAGIAGLIKLILASNKGVLPATLNCETTNQHIELDSSPFYIQKEATNFDVSQQHRFALSSFGFGGANAHVIIENYQKHNIIESNYQEQLILLSARTKSALQQRVHQLKDDLLNLGNNSLERLAYTLQVGREAMEYRLILKSRSVQDLAIQLNKYLEGELLTESKVRLLNGFPDMEITKAGVFDDNDLEQQISQWLIGENINWENNWRGIKPKRLHLSGYPFELQKYWFDTRQTNSEAAIKKQNNEIVKVEQMLKSVIEGHMDLNDVADSVGNL